MVSMMPLGVFANESLSNSGEVGEVSDNMLDVDEVSDDMLEAEELVQTAPSASSGETPITISPSGGKGSGILELDSRKYYYSVTLPSAGRLSISVTAAVDIKISLDDTGSSYTKHDFIDEGSQTLNYDLAAGTYTLEISRRIARSGEFSFTTSFASANETYTYDNNTINAVRNSKAIPFKTNINGQLALNDQDDYYKIVLSKSGRVKFNVHSDLNKLEITLHDSDDNYYRLDYAMDKGDKSYTYDLKAGTYFLQCGRYILEDGGTYRVNVGFTASGETYTYDNNSVNAVRSASSVPLAKTITGQLAHNDQYDFYKIKITSKGKYKIKFTGSMDKIDICLYDSDEVAVGDADGYSSHTHEKGTRTYIYSLSKGTYYLRAERYTIENTGKYTFKVSPYISKPKIKSIGKLRKGFRLKWKKVSGAKGYQIQYCTKKNFKGAKMATVKKGSTVTKKVKKLKAKKKYYVRIRAYKVIGGKTYHSGWSAKKTIKTK